MMNQIWQVASRAKIGAVLLALSVPIWSQPTPHLTGVAIACLGTSTVWSTQQQACDITFNEQVVSSGVATQSAGFGPPFSATVNSQASATYGFLRASTSSNFDVTLSAGARVWGDGFAAFEEVMTMTSPSQPCGSQGSMYVQFGITGNASSSGQGAAFAEVFALIDRSGLPTQSGSVLVPSSVSATFTIPMLFQYNYCQPFGLEMWLNTVSGTVAPGFANGMPVGEYLNLAVGPGAGSVNFYDTLVLSGFQVFDSQMHPVNDVTFTAGSGTPYTAKGVGLPVTIDVNPGEEDDEPPTINPASHRNIAVCIQSSSTLDAPSSIDTSSLTFGHLGIEHSLAFCNRDPLDVNGDGLPDLVCHFKTQLAGFQDGDKIATLRGQTLAGTPIVSFANVRVKSGSSE